MEEPTIIGISLETLRKILSEVIRTELQQNQPQLKKTLPADKMFTKDVAASLGVTRQTVTRYRKDGMLPAPLISKGGKPYWLREQIEAFAKESPLAYKFRP